MTVYKRVQNNRVIPQTRAFSVGLYIFGGGRLGEVGVTEQLESVKCQGSN